MKKTSKAKATKGTEKKNMTSWWVTKGDEEHELGPDGEPTGRKARASLLVGAPRVAWVTPKQIAKSLPAAPKTAKLNKKAAPIAPAKASAPKPAAAPAKAAKKEKKANGGVRVEVFGHAATAVIRWMGKHGFSFAEARACMDGLGAKAIADGTVRVQLGAGKTGQRGEPAKLSADDKAKIEKLRKAVQA